MKEILLTQGQVALVDDADFQWLSQWKWHAIYMPNIKGFYAVRGVRVDGKVIRVFMARLILGITDPKVQVDHRSLNTLDNRRENLREATYTQNASNSRVIRKNNKTGFKGVSLDGTGKWRAQIGLNGQKIYLGLYGSKEDASAAYQQKAVELHKEFARF